MRQKILARWSDRAKRTAVLGIVTGLFLMVAAFWSIGQNWVSYDLSGNPNCTTIGKTTDFTLADGRRVSVPAQCQTGWGLSDSAQQATGTENENWLPVTFGVPAITFGIMALTAVSVLGLALKNALVFLPGAFVLFQLFSSYGPTQTALQGGLDTGFYALEAGWTATTLLLAASAALFVCSGALVAFTNHKLRKQVITEVSGKESLGLISDLRVFARSGISGAKQETTV